MSRPTVSEVSAFLADLRSHHDDPSAYADLMARKADLLERIAADRPDDPEAAQIAAAARARAERLTSN
ncbi:hypothetical protein K7472_09165 [Streptomyces sp. PTM05]|uniref:Antitoxin n=1 Tax=Streptantibioticus parmotrematis TaxID=2873249 RepID=A0ABS7QPA6_9ACTN|nr:hypothetical protein [Streptantibioticus parmotrematis]MBY8885013.1 hypothetical protein [Streptantibioticus parmotrematis]